MQTQETHPFEPFLPSNARILIMGTFPPKPNRWSMKFYYPNFINDMWRIFGLIFFNDKEALVIKEEKTFKKEMIENLLKEKGIALSDTGAEAVRTKDNASDKYLEITKPADLAGLLSKIKECEAVVTTGEKAASVIASLTSSQVPKIGECVSVKMELPDGTLRNFQHCRMPSTSRAYPLSLENKTQFYKNLFQKFGIV